MWQRDASVRPDRLPLSVKLSLQLSPMHHAALPKTLLWILVDNPCLVKLPDRIGHNGCCEDPAESENGVSSFIGIFSLVLVTISHLSYVLKTGRFRQYIIAAADTGFSCCRLVTIYFLAVLGFIPPPNTQSWRCSHWGVHSHPRQWWVIQRWVIGSLLSAPFCLLPQPLWEAVCLY